MENKAARGMGNGEWRMKKAESRREKAESRMKN
jgi:hypothetical protein